MSDNESISKTFQFKRQKIINAEKDHSSKFYKTNQTGMKISGLWHQTMQPVNINRRCMSFKDGKLQLIRDLEEHHDFGKIFKINPTVFKPEYFSRNSFANIYFNRIAPDVEQPDKLYIRILDVVMKSEGFFLQTDTKYNKKPTYKMLLNVLVAGELLSNLAELEYYVESKIKDSLDFGKEVKVECKKYLKKNSGDDYEEQMMFLDFYVNFSSYHKEIPVVVNGVKRTMSPEDFNNNCLGGAYDMVFSVNPWIRYTEETGVTVGFNYNVEHIHVTENK